MAIRNEEISIDAVTAKEMGISYGQFKAGIRPSGDRANYGVSTSEYVGPSVKEDSKKAAKPKAFIRVR